MDDFIFSTVRVLYFSHWTNGKMDEMWMMIKLRETI